MLVLFRRCSVKNKNYQGISKKERRRVEVCDARMFVKRDLKCADVHLLKRVNNCYGIKNLGILIPFLQELSHAGKTAKAIGVSKSKGPLKAKKHFRISKITFRILKHAHSHRASVLA